MADDFPDFVKFEGFAGQAWYHQHMREKRILRRAREFTPERLLEKGEQGVWYDPSDTTTLFQDSAGTTPVTASGQPVGLMLDKSKGLVRGPELVTNGTFDNDLSGWVAGAWVWEGGKAKLIGDGSTQTLIQPNVFVIGRWYEVTFGTSFTGGSVGFQNSAGSIIASGSTGTVRAIWVADTSTLALKRVFGTVTGTIDNISVRELPGNHATQPTAASRPIYRRGDSRGVVNQLTWSEDFSNAVWAKGTDSTAMPNTTLAPDGSMTGDTYQNTGNNREFSQTYLTPTPEGGTFTASISIKPGTLTTFGYKIRRGDTSDGITVNDIQISSGTPEPNGFYRHKLTHTFSGSTTGDNVVVLFGANFGATGNMVIHGAQLNLGPTALPYQRNDANLGGVATGASTDLHWLETDGVDDGMVTGNINFTGTDKVSLFAGVRKLSDAARAMLLELSAAGSAGSFAINAPVSTGSGFSFVSTGSTPAAIATLATAPSPISAVLSCVGDIAADTCSLFVDGQLAASSSADQGTGNYGKYPLYLFRRGGTSLPFNGWFYGLAITGRLTTDAETVATERFLAAKSAVVIP